MQRPRHADTLAVLLSLLGLLLLPPAPALAALPPADTLLADLGYSAGDIANVKAGKMASMKPAAANERDLTAAFAFFVKSTPAAIVKDLKEGLLAEIDPATIAWGNITGGTPAELAKLTLSPDPAKRVKRYLAAAGGDDLNLSTAEIEAFKKLGASAAAPAVETQVRTALLARYEAYQKQGLAGIAAYDRGKGATRSVADEVRAFMGASKGLQKHAPAAWKAVMEYPQARPEGSGEAFRWMHFNAHGVPTIALVHGLAIPDGDALIVMQRQFYVSEGYNCEQAIAAFLPVEGGTVVVYGNHTSTDQVAGFGGGAKRSIGSKMLSSQLQDLFTKVQQQAK